MPRHHSRGRSSTGCGPLSQSLDFVLAVVLHVETEVNPIQMRQFGEEIRDNLSQKWFDHTINPGFPNPPLPRHRLLMCHEEPSSVIRIETI